MTSNPLTTGPPAATAELPGSGPLPRVAGYLRDLVTLLRPAHWAKNVYSIGLVALTALPRTATAALHLLAVAGLLVIASSIVYLGNDIADRRLDAAHPVKRHRPLASGRVGLPAALWLLAGLTALLTLLLGLTGPAAWAVGAYLALNVAYSGGLKHVPLVDAFVIALGFQLRLVAGYLAVGVSPSQWLMTSVFTVCLVLVLGKRRHELTSGVAHTRPALRGYTTALVDQMLVVCSTVTIVTVVLYLYRDAPIGAFSAQAVLVSTPFLLFGLFRYLQVLLVERGGADPVRVLLHDRALLLCIAGFSLSLLLALIVANDVTSAPTLGSPR